ncbi:replicative DNA helicase [Acetobacter fallax]|uniref:Replicative DNA helicase n=1 Tax=Acetobacter fallax TaxID=1737473 RepID=A0ABX0KAH9_9PROT|nr:replicative DNA helicase [Acetobacter fallax]NHO32429.1 replicative DNA helicase [Acetobacter fallax]NHO35903.1 replicative DNA helicase [Acetobacter fallax]
MIDSPTPATGTPSSSPNGETILGVSLRAPPANVDAEQALLGALLTNNRAYDRVSDFLTGAHFANQINGAIYDAIAKRIEGGQLADPVTLRATLEHSGILDEVGGIPYLARLLTSTVGIINAGDYGRAIHDAWLRRQLIDIGETMVNNAFGGVDLDGQDQIAAGEEQLFRLATDKGQDGGFTGFDRALANALEVAEKAFRNEGDVSGLTSGLRDFDKKTGGLHPSDLLILAGRPAMGKTALATKIAFSAARSLQRKAEEQGDGVQPEGSVAIFSLEMSAEQLATRILSEQAEVSGERIRRGDIGQKEFDRFVRVSRELAQLPMVIDDTPAISLSAMRTRCRRLKRTKGLSLVVVDYLQLMRPAVGTRPDSRVLEISMITQGLKAIAKELEVPVIALSQLSRQVESREDKRPMLSDLRESGSIEQDADAVMFVYRDEYYLQQREPKETAFESSEKYQIALDDWRRKMELVHNKAELILEKQRHGPTGAIQLFFEGEFTRFADLDTLHEDYHQ